MKHHIIYRRLSREVELTLEQELAAIKILEGVATLRVPTMDSILEFLELFEKSNVMRAYNYVREVIELVMESAEAQLIGSSTNSASKELQHNVDEVRKQFNTVGP